MIVILETLDYAQLCSVAVTDALSTFHARLRASRARPFMNIHSWERLVPSTVTSPRRLLSHSVSLCLFPLLSSPPFCSSFDVCVCLFTQTYLHSWVHFIYTIGQLISFTRNNILKLFFYFCKLCYFIQVIYKMQDSITLNEYT